MNFLQPWVLAALPLIALPIVIHLINRNRHRPVRWAAMMFLQEAKRMNKGMARLRYLLLMLMRMAAVAAIIFAISRPLVSSKIGFSWGQPDATIILLDRSASMEVLDLQSGESKRSTALKKLSALLEQQDHGNQLILIDSATGGIRSLNAPKDLIALPQTDSTATSANLPAMIEKALSWIKANEATRADLWICSDLNAEEWNAESGRWTALREEFAEMEGIRQFLLSYPDPPEANLSIRVANVKRRQSEQQAELVLDLLITGQGHAASAIPVEFEINGVRSTLEVTLDGNGASLIGHRLPIDANLYTGWGAVTLPPDSQALDNSFYFVFSEPPVRKSAIVCDDPQVGEAFRRCLAIPSESGIQHEPKLVSSTDLGTIDMEATSLLIWQTALPDGLLAQEINRFVERGGVVMFFPPTKGSAGELFGARWGDWQELSEEEDHALSWWRGDADLLAQVGSGDPLPLKELRTKRICPMVHTGNMTAVPLAILGDEQPLLSRAPTARGGAYFCSTLPTADFSSLEQNAVAFYVMLQRALETRSAALSSARQHEANASLSRFLADSDPVAEDNEASTERGLHAGVFRKNDEWIAVNRAPREDQIQSLTTSESDELFKGLAYQRIDDSVGDRSPLASEVWRAFLYLMAIALLVEAFLCLPEKRDDAVRGMASSN